MDVLVSISLDHDMLAPIEARHVVTAHSGHGPMDRDTLVSLIGDKEGLLCTITDRVDESLLKRANRLRVVANYGVGYDNIDLEACTKRGIAVSNTPDVLTDATADLTFALILAVARRVVEGDNMVRQRGFQAWTPFGFLGTEVSGKTLGIIGLGRIGKAVARRAKGFGMAVLYYQRSRLSPEEEEALCVEYADLYDLLGQSDFVSLHVPLTDKTRHLIGRRELDHMRPTAFLINTSRGPVVDEEALVEALEKGTISGAGLDVYEKEPEVHPGLLGKENTVLLPHMGSATMETRKKMAQRAIQNLLLGLEEKRPPDCLNWEQLKGQKIP